MLFNHHLEGRCRTRTRQDQGPCQERGEERRTREGKTIWSSARRTRAGRTPAAGTPGGNRAERMLGGGGHSQEFGTGQAGPGGPRPWGGRPCGTRRLDERRDERVRAERVSEPILVMDVRMPCTTCLTAA